MNCFFLGKQCFFFLPSTTYCSICFDIIRCIFTLGARNFTRKRIIVPSIRPTSQRTCRISNLPEHSNSHSECRELKITVNFIFNLYFNVTLHFFFSNKAYFLPLQTYHATRLINAGYYLLVLEK